MKRGVNKKDIIKDFQRFGALLWQRGLISYQAGNMSVLYGKNIMIKKRAAPLGFLKESDIVKAPLSGIIPEASSELPTHQAIYRKTEARAIIHSHPPHAVCLSLIFSEIVPLDTEASLLIGQRIPVITGSPEDIADSLKDHRVVIVKGHGSFAKGQSLEEAFSITTTLEHSCYIYWTRLSVTPSSLHQAISDNPLSHR